MLDTPVLILPEQIYEGQAATIQWTAVPNATHYILERKILDDFLPLQDDVGLTYEDRLPEGTASVEYRLMAYINRYASWEARDIAAEDWESRDNAAIPWHIEESEWADGTAEVTPNRPPVISGEDGHLGTKYKGFDITYIITDPDPASTVSLTVKLDGTEIERNDNVQQGVEQIIALTDNQIFAMADDSTHSITITATDNKGLVATRILTFTVAEDVISTAVFYVLRDGVPVARLGSSTSWYDYLAVGTHEYIIRGVDKYDNFVDSAPATVTITVPHPVLAAVGSPSQMHHMILRRGGEPGLSKSRTISRDSVRFEGRDREMRLGVPQYQDTINLTFTHITLNELQNLYELSGKTLIYRDQYNERAFGEITALNNDYIRRHIMHTKIETAVDYTAQLIQEDYEEAVPYD